MKNSIAKSMSHLFLISFIASYAAEPESILPHAHMLALCTPMEVAMMVHHANVRRDISEVRLEILQADQAEREVASTIASPLTNIVIGKDEKKLKKFIAENSVTSHQIMEKDEAGMNPWLAAARWGNLPAMRLFRKIGHTPPAVSCLRVRLAERRSRGSKIFFDEWCVDKDGNNAVVLAKRHGHVAVNNYLYECNAPLRAGIMVAFAEKVPKMLPPLAQLVAEYHSGDKIVVEQVSQAAARSIASER